MKNKLKKGFTLVEMMVVVAILGILTAIAVPAYNGTVESGRKMEFEANHNMIVASINTYTAAHNGGYPTKAADLDPYLYNDSGSTTSLASITTPAGATYQVTFVDNKTRPTLLSTYKSNTLKYNIK